ncbi:MAG: hypothetical protein P1P72_08580 [ANME-2 cluster archaeon]|nr:hypothetical protein [ANME-2 cluster archaeon]
MRTKTILLVLIIALLAVSIGVSAANSSQAAATSSQTTTGVNDITCPNLVNGVCNPAADNTYDCSQSSGACCNSK